MSRRPILKQLFQSYINLYLLEASKIAIPQRKTPRKKQIALYTVNKP